MTSDSEIKSTLPFSAYQGTESFIFVSYAHADKEVVYEEIFRIHQAGYRIWYDEGIPTGSNWSDIIANKLDMAVVFMVFISSNAMRSESVKNEINYFIERRKNNPNLIIISILMENMNLKGGIGLLLGSVQYLNKFEMEKGVFLRKLFEVLPTSALEKANSPSMLRENPVIFLRKKFKEQLKNNTIHFIHPFLSHPDLKPKRSVRSPISKRESSEKPRLSYEEFITMLLNPNSHNPIILLLGEAGSGKSTCLFNITKDLLSLNLSNPQSNTPNIIQTIPIFIKFSIFLTKGLLSVIELFHFIYSWCFPNNEFSSNEFELVLKTNHFILIMDGFDEFFIKVKTDAGTIDKWFEILTEFNQQYNVTTIIASRPTIWKDFRLITNLVSENNMYVLMKWTKKMKMECIEENRYLYITNKNFSAQEIFDKISNIPPLTDLCDNPFLLNCCLEIYEEFIHPKTSDDEILRYTIYDKMIDIQIRKNKKFLPADLDINEDLIRNIFRKIAIESFLTNASNLFLEDIDFTQCPFLNEYERTKIIPKLLKNYELFYNILRNYSFLNINTSYGVFFAHQSFAEYLIAETIFLELKDRAGCDSESPEDFDNDLIEENSSHLTSLKYFIPSHLTVDVLGYLIEMINVHMMDLRKYICVEDFIHFFEKPAKYEISNKVLLWFGDLYKENEAILRVDLIPLIEQGLSHQTELSLTWSETIPPIIKIIYEPDYFQKILANKNWELLALQNLPYEEIPEALFSLSKLKYLVITESYKLRKISTLIGNLRELRQLSVENAQIINVPSSIGDLTNLVELSFFRCRINMLPDTIGNLKLLQTCSLNNNRLDKLPESFGNLQSLQYLGLGGNKLTTLPNSFESLKNLLHLSLYGNKFEIFPEMVTKLIKLTYLSIQNNHLKTLSMDLGNLTELRELYAYRNLLYELPPSLTNLKKLTTLFLQENKFRIFPNSIFSLTALRFLDLSDNKIFEIPVQISNLQELNIFFINNNQIGKIADSIYNLINLKFLSLSNNYIKVILPAIGQLSKLEYLNLDYNNFTQLPIEIKSLSNLKYLRIIQLGQKLNPQTKDLLSELKAQGCIVIENDGNT